MDCGQKGQRGQPGDDRLKLQDACLGGLEEVGGEALCLEVVLDELDRQMPDGRPVVAAGGPCACACVSTSAVQFQSYPELSLTPACISETSGAVNTLHMFAEVISFFPGSPLGS